MNFDLLNFPLTFQLLSAKQITLITTYCRLTQDGVKRSSNYESKLQQVECNFYNYFFFNKIDTASFKLGLPGAKTISTWNSPVDISRQDENKNVYFF